MDLRANILILSLGVALVLDILYDDGFAAYLNGVEVARVNLPAKAGPGTRATAAVGPTSHRIDLKTHLDLLREGTNRLSVELHSAALSSAGAGVHPSLRATGAAGEDLALIPPYAAWRYQPGSAGAPPASWTEAGFDPRASRIAVEFKRPGDYRIRLDVDDGAGSGSAELEVHAEMAYIRADANGDGSVDLADALAIVFHLFAGEGLLCPKAADANDDGALDLSDALFLLGHLFIGGKAPDGPYGSCGIDPTPDALTCEGAPGCP